MLHFFSEVERSEEEKGGGAVRVFAKIRQIDQFAPAPLHAARLPDHPAYPGEGAARSGSRKKAAEAFAPAAARACLAYSKRVDLDLMLAKEQAPMRRRAQGFSLALLFFPRPALGLCFFFVRSWRV